MIKRHVTKLEQKNAKNSLEKLYPVKKENLEMAKLSNKQAKNLGINKRTSMITDKNAHFLKGKRFHNKIASDVSSSDQATRNEKRIITDYSLDKNQVPIHKVVGYLDDHDYKKMTNKVQVNGLKQHEEYFRYRQNELDMIERQENLVTAIKTVKLNNNEDEEEI